MSTFNVIKNAINSLQQISKKQLNILFKKNVSKNIVKRQQMQQNHIGRAAMWYGEKNWLERSSLYLTIMFLIAGIGTTVHLALFFTAIANTLYIAITYLLSDHYESSIKIDGALEAELLQMKETLSASIQHLQELENSFANIFTALSKYDTLAKEEINIFTTDLQNLHEKIATCAVAVENLEKTNDQVICNSTELNTTLVQVQTTNNAVANEASLLQQHNKTLTKACAEFLMDNDKIALISTQLHNGNEQLRELTKQNTVLMHTLKTQAEETYNTNTQLQQKLERINNTVTIKMDTKAITDKANTTIVSVLEYLDNVDLLTPPNINLNSHHNNNKKLLAHVDSFLGDRKEPNSALLYSRQ